MRFTPTGVRLVNAGLELSVIKGSCQIHILLGKKYVNMYICTVSSIEVVRSQGVHQNFKKKNLSFATNETRLVIGLLLYFTLKPPDLSGWSVSLVISGGYSEYDSWFGRCVDVCSLQA